MDTILEGHDRNEDLVHQTKDPVVRYGLECGAESSDRGVANSLGNTTEELQHHLSILRRRNFFYHGAHQTICHISPQISNIMVELPHLIMFSDVLVSIYEPLSISLTWSPSRHLARPIGRLAIYFRRFH
jgi:hypothetical protein